MWRELGDLARARELAVRAVELVGAAAWLDRPFAYRWRVELRYAELAGHLDPAAARAGRPPDRSPAPRWTA